MGQRLLILFVLVGFIFISSCSKRLPLIESETYSDFRLSAIKPSLISESHTAEGLAVTLSTGRIMHIFRQDPGIKGNHVGNTSAIYKRYSDDNADTWSEPELIFDDPNYDDRNISGGLTKEGDLIVFFRRYDAHAGKTVDVNYLISHDGGGTFIHKLLNGFEKRPMRFVSAVTEKGKYLVPLMEDGYKSEIRSFTVNGDDVIFNDGVWVIEDEGQGFVEPELCVDNNKILCMFRCDFTKGIYESYSLDGGKTFTVPVKTNAIADYKVSLPAMIYTPFMKSNIWIICGDRRDDVQNSKLWIFHGDMDTIIKNPNSLSEYSVIDRPKPTGLAMFYGYPTITLMKNGQYLVIISESSYDGTNEDANLYQFTLTPINSDK